MALDLIPMRLLKKYVFDERDHACAILRTDFPSEFKDILDGLAAFTLKKSEILTPGGGRSPISIAMLPVHRVAVVHRYHRPRRFIGLGLISPPFPAASALPREQL